MGKRVYKSATSKYVLTCHRVFPQLVSVSCIKPSQVRATLPSMVSVEYDHSLRLNFGGINNRSDQQLSSHVQVQWNKTENVTYHTIYLARTDGISMIECLTIETSSY